MYGVGGDGVAQLEAAAWPVEHRPGTGDDAADGFELDDVVGGGVTALDGDDGAGGAVAHPRLRAVRRMDAAVAVAGHHLVTDTQQPTVTTCH